MFSTVLIFIIILGLLVFVHEAGHFFSARRLGVRAEEFGFGFPPRLFGVYRDLSGHWRKVIGRRQVDDAADTIYSVNWVPLGGFVKIKGENGESGGPDSFSERPVWQRAIILLSGVSMNMILAMILIIIGFMVGLPQVVEDIPAAAKVENMQVQVVEVLPDTPAEAAGLRLGDVIVSLDGEPIDSREELQSYNAGRVGREIEFTVKRGRSELKEKIAPVIIGETGAGGIGIGVVETGIVSYPWYQAVYEGVKTTGYVTWAIMAAFYDIIRGLVTGQGLVADIRGPVGIASLTGQVASLGFIYILQFTAMLSINLAIINAAPFPALDGGRLLFLLVEKFKGSPVRRELETVAHNIGFILLMLLVVLITFNDVSRYSDWFRGLWQKLAG